MSCSSLKVSEKEDGLITANVPLEDDNTLLSSRLEERFSNVSYLRYRSAETDKVKGLRFADGKYYPPKGGWEKCVHFCGGVAKVDSKRKAPDDTSSRKVMRSDGTKTITDLIILGLARNTTEEHIREYFGKFGELTNVVIKRYINGWSKGFGFIRFATYEAQQTVLGHNSEFYLLNGRWCEVKIPDSQLFSKNPENKIYVGCFYSDILTDTNLREYFSKFGEISSVYVPSNCYTPYAFVGFKDPFVVQRLLCKDHVIKGKPVHIRQAYVKTSEGTQSPSSNLRTVQTNSFHANMMPTNQQLVNVVQIIQNYEHLLPLIIQSAANLAQSMAPILPTMQAQLPPSTTSFDPNNTYQAPNPSWVSTAQPGPRFGNQAPNPSWVSTAQPGPRFENQAPNPSWVSTAQPGPRFGNQAQINMANQAPNPSWVSTARPQTIPPNQGQHGLADHYQNNQRSHTHQANQAAPIPPWVSTPQTGPRFGNH